MSQHVLVKNAVITDDAILSTDAENSKKPLKCWEVKVNAHPVTLSKKIDSCTRKLQKLSFKN